MNPWGKAAIKAAAASLVILGLVVLALSNIRIPTAAWGIMYGGREQPSPSVDERQWIGQALYPHWEQINYLSFRFAAYQKQAAGTVEIRLLDGAERPTDLTEVDQRTVRRTEFPAARLVDNTFWRWDFPIFRLNPRRGTYILIGRRGETAESPLSIWTELSGLVRRPRPPAADVLTLNNESIAARPLQRHLDLAVGYRGAPTLLNALTERYWGPLIGVFLALVPFLAAGWWFRPGRKPPVRPSPRPRARLGQRICLAVVLVFAIAVRLWFLDAPMRTDESYTVERYVLPAWIHTVSDYNMPNNHFLNSVMAKVSTGLLGDHPMTVRLFVFLAGIGSVGAVYLLGRDLFSASVGLLAASLAAGWPLLIETSTNARGYPYITLFFPLLLLWGRRWLFSGSRIHWLGLSLLTALGFYAVPVMLYPFAMTWLFLAGTVAFHRPDNWKAALGDLIAFGFCSAWLTVLLFLPAWTAFGYDAMANNVYVLPLSWSDWLNKLPAFFNGLANQWFPDQVPGLGWVAAAGILGTITLNRPSRLTALGLLGSILGAFALLQAARPALPFVRVFVFIVPIVLVVAAAGLTRLGELSAGRRFNALWPVVCLAFGLLPGLITVTKQPAYALPGALTYTDARPVVALLRDNLGKRDGVKLKIDPAKDYYPLAYYANQMGLGRPWDRNFGPSPSDQPERLFWVVRNSKAKPGRADLEGLGMNPDHYKPAAIIGGFKETKVWRSDRKPL